jgi:hypothetical protein
VAGLLMNAWQKQTYSSLLLSAVNYKKSFVTLSFEGFLSLQQSSQFFIMSVTFAFDAEAGDTKIFTSVIPSVA